jgi:hypothetical protein
VQRNKSCFRLYIVLTQPQPHLQVRNQPYGPSLRCGNSSLDTHCSVMLRIQLTTHHFYFTSITCGVCALERYFHPYASTKWPMKSVKLRRSPSIWHPLKLGSYTYMTPSKLLYFLKSNFIFFTL